MILIFWMKNVTEKHGVTDNSVLCSEGFPLESQSVNHHKWDFSWFFSVPRVDCLDTTLNFITAACYPILQFKKTLFSIFVIIFLSYNKNQIRALIFQIYFWNKTLQVSGSSSVHHQEFITVHTAMVYAIQVCWHTVYHCCVYSDKLLMMDRGTARNL